MMKSDRRPTIKDVAKLAGVGHGTASAVVNNPPSRTRVSAATRERVLDAAKQLRYVPSVTARSFRTQRTNTLRLISSSHENPFFVRVAKAVDVHTRKAGYKLAVDDTLNERWTYAPGDEVGIWPVDGAIIWADETQDLVTYLGEHSETVPVVYLGYQGEDEVDAVTTNFYAGGRQAADHLVERGYKKIAMLTGQTDHHFPGADLRMAAYKDVCRENGLEVRYVTYINHGLDPECALGLQAGVKAAALPAQERPNAVICVNDVLATGLYHGVRRGGLRVPEDIAIVGFDGSIEGQCLDLPLTSVSIPVDAMCNAAVDILVRRISGDRETPARRLAFPTKLIIGGTT